MAKHSNFQRNRRLQLENLEPRQLLAVVTSAEDSGFGSLRFALETGDPIVTFDVDAMGTPNIFLESELRISRPVIIDGEQNDITIFGSDSTRCMSVLDPAGGIFPVEMRNMTMSRCRSTEGFGGAIRNEAKLTLENMSFRGNSAIGGGGLMTMGPTTIIASHFSENETFQGEGGGILIATSSQDVGIFQSEIDRNRASRGGGIFIAGTDGNNVVILDSKIIGNEATEFNGGGIFMAASAGNVTSISDSTIAQNIALEGRGGGIFFESFAGFLQVDRTTVEANVADGGSGAYLSASTAGNAPSGRLLNGITAISNSTFVANRSTAAACPGSLCVDSANAEVAQSTFSGNFGGGIGAKGGFSLNVNFTTIVENTTPVGANRGAGLEVDPAAAGTGSIANSIVAGNVVTNPGIDSDLSFSAVQLTVEHTLVGVETNTPLIPSPDMPDSDGNIVGERTAPLDPGLEPLANNGGPTRTHRLPMSSIAAGSARAGDNRPTNGAFNNSDQRGEQSFNACAMDGNQQRFSMGSFEPENCRCDFDEDGNYTPADLESISISIGDGTASSLAYDVNYDYVVAKDDVESWLTLVGMADLGAPLLVGDTLNEYVEGVGFSNSCVDISDFNVWNSNKFFSGRSYIDGDFNTDGQVDVSDFNIWNNARFTCAVPPEASTAPKAMVRTAVPQLPASNRLHNLENSVVDSIFAVEESTP